MSHPRTSQASQLLFTNNNQPALLGNKIDIRLGFSFSSQVSTRTDETYKRNQLMEQTTYLYYSSLQWTHVFKNLFNFTGHIWPLAKIIAVFKPNASSKLLVWEKSDGKQIEEYSQDYTSDDDTISCISNIRLMVFINHLHRVWLQIKLDR